MGDLQRQIAARLAAAADRQDTPVDERRLLIAVRRHLLGRGWRIRAGEAHHFPTGIAIDWRTSWHVDEAHGRVLGVDLLDWAGHRTRSVLAAEISTVAEAVDILAVFGVLPRREDLGQTGVAAVSRG